MRYRRGPDGGRRRTLSGIRRSFTLTPRSRPQQMNDRSGHRRVNRRVAGRDPDGGKPRTSSGTRRSFTPTTWHRCRPGRMNNRNSLPTWTSLQPNNAHPTGRRTHQLDPLTGRPQIGTPPPPGARRKPLAIAAGGVIVVAVAATAVHLLAGRNSQPSNISQPATTSQPSASISQPPTPTVTPVAEAALQGLLLSPDQINSITGTTAMTAYGSGHRDGRLTRLRAGHGLPTLTGPG